MNAACVDGALAAREEADVRRADHLALRSASSEYPHGVRIRPTRLGAVPRAAQELIREFLADIAPSGPPPVLVDAVEHVVDVVRLDLAHRRVVGGTSRLARQ